MIRRLAALAGLLLAAGLVAGGAWLAWPLPSRRGTVPLPGLTTPVDVRFDRQGVPHVRSVLEADAWRALGWLHAADRLLQMELRRRAAQGRLAEIFGAEAVGIDREARLLGYVRLAQRDWDAAVEDDRAVLRAYVDGINAYLSGHPVPLELAALHVTPEPWTPVDALAFERLMQDGLSMAALREQGVFEDARARGATAAVGLFDASEPGTTRVAAEVAEFLSGLPRSAAATAVAGDAPEQAPAGSNAWALAGSRSSSRRPMLAGDPHLNPERPGVWYAAHLSSADGLDVAGLTLPGGPGVLIGHNGRVAWSITMNQADDADLYLERIDPSAGTALHGARWIPLEVVSETIHVKDGRDVVVQAARTVHGPIVERFDGAPGFALARAMAPADSRQQMRPFLEAARAKDGAALIEAFSRFTGPAINVCWADATGSIGVKVAGAVPIRGAGDGRFPVPGWTGAYDWRGTIPYDELPATTNPPEGFVTSANDDWSVTGKPLPYPGLYAEPDRAARARELAAALHAATVADMRAMQTDVYSPYAARLLASIAAMNFTDARAARAAALLRRWDARAETRGPSRLFYAFLRELRGEVAAPIGRGTSGAWVTWSLLDRLLAGTAPASYWDDPATPRVESGRDRVEQALAAALDAVEREDGTDPNRWSWGKVHRLAYAHPFARALPRSVARRLQFGPVALPGEWHTLDVAGFSLSGDRYDVTHIPSARLIVDLGDPDASRLVLPLGQSGQMFDRHSHDQLRRWSAGEDFPLPFTAKAVAAATVSTLRFVPED